MMAWLRRFFNAEPPQPRPRPVGWNKTLSELSAENRSLSAEEIIWAREYEREQLRAWVRFPKDGERFEACHDVQITYMIHWRAPYTTGGEGSLPKGTLVRVSVHPNDPEPIGVYTTPVDEKAMEELLVPEADRLSRKYGGYSVFLSVAQLNTDFRLAE